MNEHGPLISTRYSRAHIAGALLGRREFQPFRVALPGTGIGLLDPSMIDTETASWYRREAERAAGSLPFPAIPASLYRSWLLTGRHDEYSRLYFARRNALGALAMGAWLSSGTAFAEPLVDAIWQICDEASWLLPAHNYRPAGGGNRELPDPYDPWVDIFSGETAALLAWTLYLNEPSLDAIERRVGERIRSEVRRRVIRPYLERSDYWWMGFERDPGVVLNNWNPWCNSNVLAATLLQEEDDETRLRVVARAISSLELFLAGYRDDGGCDEGTMYWTAAAGCLFDALELLSLGTGGSCTFWDVPRIRNMLRYPVLTHIDRDWYVNFADGDARLAMQGELLYRAGERFGDAELMGLGSAAFRWAGAAVRPATYYPLYRLLRGLQCSAALRADTRGPAYPADAWLEGVQVLVARETAGSPRGFYLAAKGGHNGESHSHNDVGSFIVYLDGEPVLVDPGTESYSKQTFDPVGRWALWTTRSSYHNLPEIDGVEQRDGRAFAAERCTCERSPEEARLSLDIAGAYPSEASIISWLRDIRLQRTAPASVRVTDTFRLRTARSGLVWNFVVRAKGSTEPGSVRLVTPSGAVVVLAYDPHLLDSSVERIALDDERIRGVWGDELHRVRLRLKAASAEGVVEVRIERPR